jgi:hypothetical protein
MAIELGRGEKSPLLYSREKIINECLGPTEKASSAANVSIPDGVPVHIAIFDWFFSF